MYTLLRVSARSIKKTTCGAVSEVTQQMSLVTQLPVLLKYTICIPQVCSLMFPYVAVPRKKH
jgi:hypothetical protein